MQKDLHAERPLEKSVPFPLDFVCSSHKAGFGKGSIDIDGCIEPRVHTLDTLDSQCKGFII